MAPKQVKTSLRTHRVTNQVAPWQGVSLYASDGLLRDWLRASPAADFEPEALRFGEVLGRAETWEWARQANASKPELLTFDRSGHRLDEVRYHPAYHHLMRLACEAGVPSIAWRRSQGGHQAHAALEYMLCQVEAGVCCPVTMSYAAAPVLANKPAFEALHAKLITPQYDASSQPVEAKVAATMGMAMTEKQGGSDLRSVTTSAQPIGGDAYELTGHKWFCSAPMSDAFLTLAQTAAGLTCFVLPRWRPDGRRNGLEFQRLKDKLGNHANASSEVEFHGAWAQRIGEEGRGIATIIEMVHHTRLDCAVAAAGLMRQALVQALHHASHRSAFGKRLIEQPLMRRVLADLALESEAATVLAMRAAELCDEAEAEPERGALARLGVAVAKYWNNKRCPLHVVEAMECLGGAGYVEDGLLPRLYREAPLNGIWEGSGNVICLDLMRTFSKEPALPQLVLAELGPRAEPIVEGFARAEPEQARHLAGRLARLWQCRLLDARRGDERAAIFDQARSANGAFGEWLPKQGIDGLLADALPVTA